LIFSDIVGTQRPDPNYLRIYGRVVVFVPVTWSYPIVRWRALCFCYNGRFPVSFLLITSRLLKKGLVLAA